MSDAPEISVVVPVFDEEGAAPDLAREIAAFQSRADVAPPGSHYGDAAQLAELVQDNFKPLLGLISR